MEKGKGKGVEELRMFAKKHRLNILESPRKSSNPGVLASMVVSYTATALILLKEGGIIVSDAVLPGVCMKKSDVYPVWKIKTRQGGS